VSSEAQGAILDAISEVFEPVISQVKKVRGIHPSATSKASPFTGKEREDVMWCGVMFAVVCCDVLCGVMRWNNVWCGVRVCVGVICFFSCLFIF
jgi:hypothetical protein